MCSTAPLFAACVLSTVFLVFAAAAYYIACTAALRCAWLINSDGGLLTRHNLQHRRSTMLLLSMLPQCICL
jgi:hypothetical protein